MYEVPGNMVIIWAYMVQLIIRVFWELPDDGINDAKMNVIQGISLSDNWSAQGDGVWTTTKLPKMEPLPPKWVERLGMPEGSDGIDRDLVNTPPFPRLKPDPSKCTKPRTYVQIQVK